MTMFSQLPPTADKVLHGGALDHKSIAFSELEGGEKIQHDSR